MRILYLLIYWIPFVVTLAVLVWLFWQKVFRSLHLGTVKRSVFIVLIIFLIQMMAKMIFFYFATRDSTLGKYLLSSDGYLWRNFYYILQSYLQNILVGIIFLLFALLSARLSRRTIFEKADFWIIFLVTFVASFPGVFVMLLAALFSMILVQLFLIVFKKKKQFRLDPIPFFLVGTVTVGILNGFQFYQNLLSYLHLI